MTTKLGLTAAAVALLGGCALKGDVRRVERQLLALQAETARADSARAVEVARVIDLLRATQDSINAHQRSLTVLRGELRSDVTEVQRLLVQVQELTGQSQQRLSELRTQLERRDRLPPTQPVAGATQPQRDSAGAALPGPEQLFELGLQQLRRGSPATARVAFQQFLQAYATHERAPDVLYFLGEAWGNANPDSAALAYETVARGHPNSVRAPAALYKLGLLAEGRGDREAARVYYQRVLSGYPRSEEAQLAREKLGSTP